MRLAFCSTGSIPTTAAWILSTMGQASTLHPTANYRINTQPRRGIANSRRIEACCCAVWRVAKWQSAPLSPPPPSTSSYDSSKHYSSSRTKRKTDSARKRHESFYACPKTGRAHLEATHNLALTCRTRARAKQRSSSIGATKRSQPIVSAIPLAASCRILWAKAGRISRHSRSTRPLTFTATLSQTVFSKLRRVQAELSCVVFLAFFSNRAFTVITFH